MFGYVLNWLPTLNIVIFIENNYKIVLKWLPTLRIVIFIDDNYKMPCK